MQSWRFGLTTATASGSEVDAQLSRAACRGSAANAAVDRDDKPNAIGLEAVESGRLQAVAVADAFGHEVHDVTAEQL